MPRMAQQDALYLRDTMVGEQVVDLEEDECFICEGMRENFHCHGPWANLPDATTNGAVLAGLLELRESMCAEILRLEQMLGSCATGVEMPVDLGFPRAHGPVAALPFCSRGLSTEAPFCTPEKAASVQRVLDDGIPTLHASGHHAGAEENVNGTQSTGSDQDLTALVRRAHSSSCWRDLTEELRLEDEQMRANASHQSGLSKETSFYERTKKIQWHNTVDLNEEATPLKNLVRGRYFETFFCMMIFTNALLMAVQVQYNIDHVGEPEPLLFKVLGHIYNVMFLFELVLRLAAEGCKGFYCSKQNSGWACLDTLVVAVSCFDLAVDIYTAVGEQSEDGDQLVASNMRILRIVRMAKILRSFRAFKLLRLLNALHTLLFSIFVTLKSLAWATVLIFVVIFVFGLTFAQCAADGLAERDGLAANSDYPLFDEDALTYYWGSLSAAMTTLFQTMSNGISWRPAYEALCSISYMCGWMFNLFIGFSYFVMLNVITGVFCNSAIESAAKNPEVIAHSLVTARATYIKNLSRLFQAMDTDNSGSITMGEFEELMHDDLARAHFQALELNVGDAWTLFKLIDQDGSGSISITEFLSGCEALKGGARSIDVAAILYETRVSNAKLFSRIGRVESLLLGIVPQPHQDVVLQSLPSASLAGRDEDHDHWVDTWAPSHMSISSPRA